tara:strand:- start:320 stop:724 length:405 start_codon:yes stop_codon:yes gene_type:complete
MAAGRYSFVIEQGATTDFEIRYADSGSNAIDLTGYRAKMQIRTALTSSSTLLLTLTSSLAADGTGLNLSGSNGTNPLSSGSIGVFISAHSSSQLSGWNEAFYDLELISGSTYPVVTRILEGKVQLSKEVTSGTY